MLETYHDGHRRLSGLRLLMTVSGIEVRSMLLLPDGLTMQYWVDMKVGTQKRVGQNINTVTGFTSSESMQSQKAQILTNFRYTSCSSLKYKI